METDSAAPLAASSFALATARARFCRRRSAAIPAIDTPHCSCPRTAIISSFLTADSLLPCDENVEACACLRCPTAPFGETERCNLLQKIFFSHLS